MFIGFGVSPTKKGPGINKAPGLRKRYRRLARARVYFYIFSKKDKNSGGSPLDTTHHHGKTPNINLVIPLCLHNNFWSSVGTRHNEFIIILISKSGLTKITDEWPSPEILRHVSRGINSPVRIDFSWRWVLALIILKLFIKVRNCHWEEQVLELEI